MKPKISHFLAIYILQHIKHCYLHFDDSLHFNFQLSHAELLAVAKLCFKNVGSSAGLMAAMSNAIRVLNWLSKLSSVSKMGQYDSLRRRSYLLVVNAFGVRTAGWKMRRNQVGMEEKGLASVQRSYFVSCCCVFLVRNGRSHHFSPHKESELENWQVANAHCLFTFWNGALARKIGQDRGRRKDLFKNRA